MRNEDPGFLPPYQWRRQPNFSATTEGVGQHAVVVSWHIAPDFGTMAGQDRLLGFWAEPLLDALVQAGYHTTLLIVGADGDPAKLPLTGALQRRRINLALAAGDGPLGTCVAVDEALARLAPDVVHAPERRGLLATALSRRAAGLAHHDPAMVLHARGPTLFQAEEQARFIDDVDLLLLDDLERQAMRLADQLVCCSPEVAAWLARGPAEGGASVECRMVAPLVWQLPPMAPAAATELVYPLPLCSEAGLEFAVATLARARSNLTLPVTFLGQPGPVTVGNAASVLAGLAPPASSGAARLAWRVLIAETPQRTMEYLARPGRVALLTAHRAAPPEMLAMCGAAGIPVLATDNAVTRDAAARWPSIRLMPRAERSVAAALGRLPALPEIIPATPPPALPLPSLGDTGALAGRALAMLAEPEALELTVLGEARPSLLAALSGQSLRRFAITLLLPPLLPLGTMPRPPAMPAERPLQLLPGDASALGRALAACETRYAVLYGGATGLAPDALLALLRAARTSGAAAIAAWDTHSRPTGGGGDMALLRPGATVGHVVLLDLPALRAAGGASLAAAGTPAFAAALATESGGVMMLPAELAQARAAPPPPLPGNAALPPRLAGAAALALHFAATPPDHPLPADASELSHTLAATDRQSTHYLKLVGRLLDGMGLEAAAADVWRARLARDPDDGETWQRHASLGLAAAHRLPDIEALGGFVRRHGTAALGSLPEQVARQAYDLLQGNAPGAAMQLLAESAPVLQGANAYIQALARTHARLTRAGEASALPALESAAHAALRAALEHYALVLPPQTEDDAA